MAKLSKERIAAVVKATHHENAKVPFYFAPPFLDQLRTVLQKREVAMRAEKQLARMPQDPPK